MTIGGQQNRAYLRIPVRIPAALYCDGRLYKKLILSDLSAKGLSFFISPTDDLPDIFEVRFRLRPFSRTVKIVLQVKNRIALSEGTRVGCAFLEISDPDQKRIDHYVCHFVGISFPVQAVNFAAFLCAIDASLRLGLYYLDTYYSATDFGRSFSVPVLSDRYGPVLAVYAGLAFLAFVCSSSSILRRGRAFFSFSLLLLLCAYLFLFHKNYNCWTSGLWDLYPPYTNIFLAGQSAVALYLGFAIVLGTVSLKKIALALSLIEKESAALKLNLEQLKLLRKERI